MLSVRSPSGAMIEITMPSTMQVAGAVPGVARVGDADDDQRQDRDHRPADQALDGLVGADPGAQRRAAGGAADEQRADVVGHHAEGEQEQRVGADAGADEPGRREPVPFENRRISAANEPSRPIHTTPSVVMAMFGIGPASRLCAPMNVIDAGDERRGR